jgi:hypothetical protein
VLCCQQASSIAQHGIMIAAQQLSGNVPLWRDTSSMYAGEEPLTVST